MVNRSSTLVNVYIDLEGNISVKTHEIGWVEGRNKCFIISPDDNPLVGSKNVAFSGLKSNSLTYFSI
jgi:hypothetical protein